MPQGTLLNYQEGQVRTDAIDLPAEIFETKVSRSLLYEVIRAYQANLRQGTSATKTRSEVRGGGAKPWRQKGTGRARQGSIRSPLWRKGGIIFGPQARDYRIDMPEKKRQAALKSALSAKFKEGELTVLANFTLPEKKTKPFVQFLQNLGIAGRRILLVPEVFGENLRLAGRNIPWLDICPAQQLNAYWVLQAERVVITEGAIAVLKKRLNNETNSEPR